MNMHNPPHPGEIIRGLCLEPLELSVSKAALGLGVTRKSLSQLLNGHSGVSTEMAMRLSLAFGSSPETWLAHQMAYDLWQLHKKKLKFAIKPFKHHPE